MPTGTAIYNQCLVNITFHRWASETVETVPLFANRII